MQFSFIFLLVLKLQLITKQSLTYMREEGRVVILAIPSWFLHSNNQLCPQVIETHPGIRGVVFLLSLSFASYFNAKAKSL